MKTSTKSIGKQDNAARLTRESFDYPLRTTATGMVTQPRSKNGDRSFDTNVRPSSNGVEALDKPDIAELSTTHISQMTDDELVRVILAARLPLLQPEMERHLRFYDHAALQRLAHLSRRCCRNQGY